MQLLLEWLLVTETEIGTSIKTLASEKSPGKDIISSNLLKTFPGGGSQN